MARRQEDSDDGDQRSVSYASEEEIDSGVDEEEEDDEGDEEEDEEDEDGDDEEEDQELKAADTKHNLVEADLSEIRKMMEEMDKIKMRLQFRLPREQGDSSQGSPSRRRSSWEEIVVPVTAAAAVQTTWNMSSLCDVEKLISSHETKPPAVPTREVRGADLPIKPSVQLSLEDLAKSYGVEDAVFRNGESNNPQSLVRNNSGPSPEEYSRESVRPASMRPDTDLWDGLVTGARNTRDIGNHSDTSSGKPPKLNRSQLIPESESSVRSPSPIDSPTSVLGDSFGAPASPTHAGAYTAATNDNSRGEEINDGQKTVEQKEMEAMKDLLFF